MDLGGFQNNVSNTERVCTSVPLNVDVGQTTPDASIMVPGELPSINIRENELRVLNTQPPTLSGEISILECDTDWASGSFNPGPLPAELAHVQHSSANASLYLEVQSRLPVQCTSPNPSIDRAPDTLILQVQPPAQSCMETMFTPASADHGFSQQGQLLFLASADPASTSSSQNHVGLFQGENQGHPGLLQQRNFSQPGKPMVPFQGCFHSKQPKNSVPNPREMAEQGFTYLAMLFATDEYGQKYSLHGPVKRPDYAEYIKRFNSFPIMPSSVPKTSKELASAGFYFLREPDQVACFSCGVGFQNWEPDDDPWEEHAHQSRNCTYVTKVLRFRFVALSWMRRVEVDYQPSCTREVEVEYQPSCTGRVEADYNVSNISLDAIPSMSREISYQAIADMGYQPDQIRRAITKLKGKKHIGAIDTNSIVNEILEMDETKVTPQCFKCHQEMRNGYTLLPCGHVAICLNCDVKKILVCPVCDGRVTGCVITYPAILH